MDKENVKKRLTGVFRDVFDDEGIELSESTTADDIEAWDSLEHITLISAVEKEFKMRFTMKEVSGMKNVGEMMNIVAERAKK
ncbi:MAG: acyl carrier protein [Lachnospiraceae bacterium]|nr:acyl carrier protein [Ruminococcus sp.]MCM1273867.1 acyl carrier protein [Lachnospiraceae bacterium]